MTVSITYIQTRSIVGAYYNVSSAVTTSSGIASEIFVKRESTEEFDRVATVSDMSTFPTTPDPNEGYYREADFDRDFMDVVLAQEFADDVKRRIELLADEYDLAVGDFEGSDTNTTT